MIRNHQVNMKWSKRLEIALIFLIVAFSEVIVLLIGNKYNIINDSIFHLLRITGITQAIKQGTLLPHFDFWMDNGNGSAIDTFYPYLTVEPIALIYTVIHRTITSWFIILGIIIFIGMIISYYASQHVITRQKRRIVFAIVYLTSGSVMNSAIYKTDLGEFLAFIFLPLVFFGFIKLLKYGQWRQLAIGAALIIYSHIDSSIIIGCFIAILALINIKQIKAKPLIKAVIGTILLSSYQIIPMAYLMMTNHLLYPHIIFNPQNTTLIINLKYYIVFICGINSTLGIIAGLANYKKESCFARQITIISVILFIMQITVLPWILFRYTFLNYLQIPEEPDRMLMLSEICTSYLLATNLSKKKSRQNIETVIIMLIAILLPIYKQTDYVKDTNNLPKTSEIHSKMVIKNTNRKKRIYQENSYLGHSSQIKYILNTPFQCVTQNDYYPKNVKPVMQEMQNDSVKSQRHYVNFINHHNGRLSFRVRHYYRNLALPVNGYNGIKYQINSTRRQFKYSRNHHHLLVIHDVKPGRYTIKVKNQPNAVYGIAEVITLLTILAFLYRKEQ